MDNKKFFFPRGHVCYPLSIRVSVNVLIVQLYCTTCGMYNNCHNYYYRVYDDTGNDDTVKCTCFGPTTRSSRRGRKAQGNVENMYL